MSALCPQHGGLGGGAWGRRSLECGFIRGGGNDVEEMSKIPKFNLKKNLCTDPRTFKIYKHAYRAM